MKKRVFAIMAAVLFIVSTVNLNASSEIIETDCVGVALDFVDAYEFKHGCVDAEAATYLYETMYFICLNPSIITNN